MAEGGKADELKGRVKEAAGSLLDDSDLKQRGRMDQAAGKVKQKAEELIDRAKDIVKGDDEDEKQEKKK